jgi:hypothetical protein
MSDKLLQKHMKLIIIILVSIFGLQAQVPVKPAVPTPAAKVGATAPVNIGLIVKCPQSTVGLLMWSGTGFICASLGSGLQLTSAGVLQVIAMPPPISPLWQVDTFLLGSLASSGTVISVSTSHSPINGAIMYWYNSTNIVLASSGAMNFSGNPLTFNLPLGWSAADTITVLYQYQ